MFISVADELKKAQKGKYAIGAFNTNNLEVTKAIISAAKEADFPVIIQTTPSAIKYAGLKQIFMIVKAEIEENSVKAAIHLDHAKDFETVKATIDMGYKSVMIDGSHLPFSENVALTRKVVDYAHPKNVSVEAEIGMLGIQEGGEVKEKQVMSDPEQTAKFVEITGIDSVAVSIGNQHGAPTGEKIDLDLLETISSLIDVPLVLHGSSGLSDKEITKAIDIGVTKINVDTLVRKAFIKSLFETKPGTVDYRVPMIEGMKNVHEVVYDRINKFRNI